MDIRQATNQDIPGIIRLLRQVGQVHHDIRPDLFRPGVQKYDEQALQALLQDPMRPIFVALDEEVVTAHCFTVVMEYANSPVFVDRKELYIDDLCVDENHRRMGIAEEMYRYVCGYARQLGCRNVVLDVWSGNDSAQRFYEKMGMRPRKTGMEMPLGETEC